MSRHSPDENGISRDDTLADFFGSAVAKRSGGDDDETLVFPPKSLSLWQNISLVVTAALDSATGCWSSWCIFLSVSY